MFRKAVMVTLGCCLLALAMVLLQACFFPLGGTSGTSGTSLSGLWEGTLSPDDPSQFVAGLEDYDFMVVMEEPRGGGITGSARINLMNSYSGRDVAAVMGLLSGSTITLYVGHLEGATTFEFLGAISGNTISGTYECSSIGSGTFQLTRTYKYYTQSLN